jgi:hypothetical protein
MWWSLGIEVAHLYQKRHCDLLVGYEVDVYRTAIRNPKVTKKADRVIRYDCAEGRFTLWRLVKGLLISGERWATYGTVYR